jgi:hypothetical protein
LKQALEELNEAAPKITAETVRGRKTQIQRALRGAQERLAAKRAIIPNIRLNKKAINYKPILDPSINYSAMFAPIRPIPKKPVAVWKPLVKPPIALPVRPKVVIPKGRFGR